MSDPGSGNRPADEADVLAEARRTARAGAKPDHDPELRSEDPELLEQAVGRGQGGEAGAEGRAAAARDDDLAATGNEAAGDREDEVVDAEFDDELEDDADLGEDANLGDDAAENGDDLSSAGAPREWGAGDAAGLPAEEVSLAPVAPLESLPVFRQVPGLAEPLSLRSPERFLASPVESVLTPGPETSAAGADPVSTMQPWAETGSIGGRNKRPLDDLLAEYAARIAAAPQARAGVPEGRHPAEVYLDRFRSAAGRAAGRGEGTAAGGRQGRGAEPGAERGEAGDRAGRRGRRGRGGERRPETPSRTAASAEPGSAAGRSQQTGPAPDGAERPGGRSGRRGRRRGGQRTGTSQPAGVSSGAGSRPAGGGRPAQAPASETGESRTTSSRRRGRGRGRGRGPRGGGSGGPGGGGAASGGGGPAGGAPAG